MERICTKCQKLLPFADFVKSSRNKNGVASVCKECQRAISKEWVKNNPEKHAESQKKCYSKNLEKRKKVTHEYYLNNKKRKRELEKIWRGNNKEKSADIFKKSRARNSKRVKQYKEKYISENREKAKGWYNVKQAIKNGILPSPRTLECIKCSGPAKEYHHHNGYDEQHLIDVVPLCHSCHITIHVQGT